MEQDQGIGAHTMWALRFTINSLIFYVSLFVCSVAWSATYYVDFDAGADTNNGSSTGTAFKHCPGDDSATNTAASTTLSAGDSVIFKGGVNYKGRIDLDWSGSAGSVITYDGNSAGSWGSGKAIINGENIDTDARRFGFYSTNARHHIKIYNFEFVDLGGLASLASYNCTDNLAPEVKGYGVYLEGGNYNVEIKDCYFHEIGTWEATGNTRDEAISGVGIILKGRANNITIDGCEFTKVSQGVYLLQTGDSGDKTFHTIEIKNCNIHNYIRWGVSVGMGQDGGSVYGLSIHDNTIHDTTEYDKASVGGGWSGCGGDPSSPHTDHIILFTGGGGTGYANLSWGTPTPNKIYNNTFYQNATGGGGTASIFISIWGGPLWVYNNTFVNVLHAGEGGIYLQDAQNSTGNSLDLHIYNNSFFDAVYCVFLRTLTTGCELDRSGNAIRVKNNIFYSTNDAGRYAFVAYTANDDPTELDYNIYVTARGDNLLALFSDGSFIYRTLADLKTAGYEANGYQSNPLYTNISYGLGASSSSNDLTLQAASPAVGAGSVLSSYFSTDKNGVVRGTSWDIGAYEHAASGTTYPAVKLGTGATIKLGTGAGFKIE